MFINFISNWQLISCCGHFFLQFSTYLLPFYECLFALSVASCACLFITILTYGFFPILHNIIFFFQRRIMHLNLTFLHIPLPLIFKALPVTCRHPNEPTNLIVINTSWHLLRLLYSAAACELWQYFVYINILLPTWLGDRNS